MVRRRNSSSAELPDVDSCLVLDVRLPGVSGLDFQGELAKAKIQIPIIFITGHGDIPMSVRAMKAGAVEFLTKPFRDQELLDAIQVALSLDRTRRESEKAASLLRRHYETLTSREREVMALVAAGLMNKQIAAELNISEVTVKVHRGHVMSKMGARSLAELVRMAGILGLRARAHSSLNLCIVSPIYPSENTSVCSALLHGIALVLNEELSLPKVPVISIVDDDEVGARSHKRAREVAWICRSHVRVGRRLSGVGPRE